MAGRLARKHIDVERLVSWAMLEQGLGWAGKERSFEDWSDYGGLIDDAGSHPKIVAAVSDDALTVKAVVDALPEEARVLLTLYGRSSGRPDWAEEGEGSWRQLVDGRGRPRWEWSDAKNRTGEKRPLMGFVGLEREVVEFHRAQYAVWHQALIDILAPLNMRLAEHMATGPEAPAMPWTLDESDPARKRASSASGRAAPVRTGEETPDERRRRANAAVRSQASDWSLPERGEPLATGSLAPEGGG